MSLAALARLEAHHEALIVALDRNDPAAIADASAQLGAELALVRAVDAWTQSPELKLAAERVAGLADAAAMRVNVLTDQARRRAQALATARGQSGALTYTR